MSTFALLDRDKLHRPRVSAARVRAAAGKIVSHAARAVDDGALRVMERLFLSGEAPMERAAVPGALSVRRLLAVVVIVAGCDRGPASAPEVAQKTNNTVAATAAQAPVNEEPKPVVPRAPDYEDARAVVHGEGGAFTLLLEGEKPICMPFEAPADARVDGARVRFTLYLDEGATPIGCRPVQTLISMRVEPAVK